MMMPLMLPIRINDDIRRFCSNKRIAKIWAKISCNHEVFNRAASEVKKLCATGFMFKPLPDKKMYGELNFREYR